MEKLINAVISILLLSTEVLHAENLGKATNDVSVDEDPPPIRRKHLIPSIERMSQYPQDTEDNRLFSENLYAPNIHDKIVSQDTNHIHRSPKGVATITAMDILAHKQKVKKRDTREQTKKSYTSKKGKAHNARHNRSIRAASYPAVEAVDENSPLWKRLSTEKPMFVTSKTNKPQAFSQQGRSISNNDDKTSTVESPNPKTNEISGNKPQEYERKKEYLFRDDPYRNYPVNDYNRYDDLRGPPPQRGRIIYYADLPEVVRHGPQDLSYPYYKERGPYSRYEAYPEDHKYPRESRFEDPRTLPVPVASGDRYRYQPAGRNRFTIIDAPDRGPPPRYPYQSYERSPPPQPPPAPRDYYDTSRRYNRIPAPYSPLSSNGRSQYDRSPVNEDLARRYPYNDGREAVRPSTGTGYSTAPIEGEDPYRDYNPRQPAPWSMQIGARLTVKDDGRPMSSRPGRPGRPFYVQGERDQYPSRYRRDKDSSLT